jgi:hypothetical protein
MHASIVGVCATRRRKGLQRKGARSATRRLIVVSGRERRLKQRRNHIISRSVVDVYPCALIGREDVSHIRERTKRKQYPKASQKQRKANRRASQWTFVELQGGIAYKRCLPAAWRRRWTPTRPAWHANSEGMLRTATDQTKGAIHLQSARTLLGRGMSRCERFSLGRTG